MARICMLLTATRWSDRRQFHRQAPALVVAGHEVVYMAGDPGQEIEHSFTYRILSWRQIKLARLTGALNLFWRIVRQRPAVLQLCSVEQIPVGLAIKLLTRIKVVYDCREDMASAMMHRDRWSKPRCWMMSLITKIMERLGDRLFDGMVASDPAICKIHAAMPQGRTMVFYNVPTLSVFARDYPPLAERKYDIVMMGSMTARSGVVPLLEAIGMLKERGRNVSVLLLGEPISFIVPKLDMLIAKYDLAEQINKTGWIMHNEVVAVLAQAKIGIVPLLDMPKFRRNIACKAFEYMACGIPVISSDLPPEHLFIKEPVNGLFFPPGDVEAMADRIVELLDDLPRAQKMGEAGRDDIERQWNCERYQRELVDFYARILQTKPRWKLRDHD